MERRIIYHDPKTDCDAVVIPAYADHVRPPDDTEEALLQRCVDRNVPPGVPYRIVNVVEISTDRTFRNAWKENGQAIIINMPKARVIHTNRIRKARDVELAVLDIPFLKARETGDNA